MKVLRADAMGMCFGVRDALAVMADLPDPQTVTVHGQLVHNPVVLTDLKVRGFTLTDEADRARLPDTPAVLITAHGVSDRERARLSGAGKHLIDTTCPLVKRVHAAAQRLAARTDHVLVIGRPGHVEVLGIVEDLPSCTIVPDVAAVAAYPYVALGVVAQTTTPPAVAAAVRAEIVRRNPHAAVHYVDTVCAPTRDRQRALERLLPQVEVVVVVGGAGSNNTRELTALVGRVGVPAYQVEGPAEVRSEWFDGVTTAGLTAGTSTLAATVDAVEAAMLATAAEPARCGRPLGAVGADR